MSELLTWWLSGPRAGDARLVFDWALTPTGWAMVLLACGVLAWLSYQRLIAPAWARWTGTALRACTLALLALLACGPRLVQTTERVEKDWVVVLADRSASMGVRDVDGRSRAEQLVGVLGRTEAGFGTLDAQRKVVWLGFDSVAYPLLTSGNRSETGDGTGAAAGVGLSPTTESSAAQVARELAAAPTGTRSDLAGALAEALRVATARPLSGVVVLSDGQSTTAIPPSLVRELQSKAVGVYPLPLGSSGPTGDVAVLEATAPSAAFAGDSVPVGVTLRRTGVLSGPVTVELVEAATGRVLDQREASFGGDASEAGPESGSGAGPGSGAGTAVGASDALAPSRGPATARLTLVGTPSADASSRWVVRVTPLAGELLTDNNRRELRLRTVQRPLRLMYIDGGPRWEYRFLKNVLARERSVRFNATILSPGRRYIAEGAEEVFTLPTTPAGWDQYDVIMLGDVQPGVFTPEQMAQLRQRVTVGGAGLVWIAGAGAVPNALGGTALADLLPIVTGSAGGSSERIVPWSGDVTMRPTPLAERLGVLRLGDRQEDGSFWPASISDPRSGWSRLRWAQRLDPGLLKPAAEVLAMAEPVDGGSSGSGGGGALPLVVTMRYGAGRVVYVGTDELWRFRYGRGEELVERFYLQLIRLLGRESVARAGRAITLEVSPTRAEVGTPVRVTAELVDQTLIESAPASVVVRIEPVIGPEAGLATGLSAGSDAAAARPIELTLRPELAPSGAPSGVGSGAGSGVGTGAGRGTGAASNAARRTYVATWVPSVPGALVARVTAPVAGVIDGQSAEAVTAEVQVVPQGDELATPQTDHPLLVSLAQQTGGVVLDEAKLGRLSELLPRREVRVVTPTTQATLWDRPSWLLLLVLLLGAEWTLRRVVRLT